MCELFTLEGRCAVQFGVTVKNVVTRMNTCSVKVNIIQNDKHIYGYILDEVDGQWKIQLMSNAIIWMNILNYNQEERMVYVYLNPTSRCRIYITTYWPIRLVITSHPKRRNRYNQPHHHTSQLMTEHIVEAILGETVLTSPTTN